MREWLSRQLSKLTLVPVALLFLVVLIDLFISIGVYQSANYADNAAVLVDKTSALVHEMQKERGMSAGYIGSKGASFSSQLKNQRTLTDNRLSELKATFAELSLSEGPDDTINNFLSQFAKVNTIRRQVDDLSIKLGDALAFYTRNNEILLNLNSLLATTINDATTSRRFQTLYNVAYAKEQAGIERAVLSNVFARDVFTPQLYVRFIQLRTRQQTYLKSATLFADTYFEGELNQFVNSKEQQAVENYRNIAENSDGAMGQSSEAWFKAATDRINLLRNTERALTGQISEFAQVTRTKHIIVMVVEILLLALVSVIAYVVFSTIRNRAAQAAEINRVMKAVDEHQDLTQSADIITQDELGEIAKLINQTFEHVKQDFILFQQNSTDIASASSQTASAVEQSKNNLVQLEMDITGIASAVEQMSASINQVIHNVESVSASAKTANVESKHGEKAVNLAVNGIQDTAQEISEVGQTIEQLNDKVSDILSMVDVIKSVAEQTNLLALNAAIEAARAGEQGRGFAVVADEVRSLAQRTQTSTKEISDVVDVLRTSSQSAFDTIESSDANAKEAVARAKDVTNVLGNIVDEIKHVDEATSAVALSAKEQGDVINSINQNVTNIDQQAHENVVGAEQIAAASVQLSQVAQTMKVRLQTYRVK